MLKFKDKRYAYTRKCEILPPHDPYPRHLPKDPFTEDKDPSEVFFNLFKGSLAQAVRRFCPRRKEPAPEKPGSDDDFDPRLRPSKKVVESEAKKLAEAAAEAEAATEKTQRERSNAILENLQTLVKNSSSSMSKMSKTMDKTSSTLAQLAAVGMSSGDQYITQVQAANLQYVDKQQNQHNQLQQVNLPGGSRELNGLDQSLREGKSRSETLKIKARGQQFSTNALSLK